MRELLLKYRLCIWILTITQTGAAHTILTDLWERERWKENHVRYNSKEILDNCTLSYLKVFLFLRVDWQWFVYIRFLGVSPTVPVRWLFGQRKVSWRRCQSRSLWSPSHSSPGPGQRASCLWSPWIPKRSKNQ